MKIYTDTRARRRAYYQRRKDAGRPIPRGKSGKSGKSGKTGYFDRFFVAIDSEGMNYGPVHETSQELWDEAGRKIVETLSKNFVTAEVGAELWRASMLSPPRHSTVQWHRTFLWGAWGVPLNPPLTFPQGGKWLCHVKRDPLTSKEILTWLCGLREHYGPRAIFVSFAFGYDAAQALADLPVEDMLAVHQNATPLPTSPRCARGGGKSYHLWEGFLIRYLKGKYFSVARMLPGKKFVKRKNGKWKLNKGPSTVIYDTWGFFQSSLLNALRASPDAGVSAEDMALIERGKKTRVDFSATPLAEIIEYTRAECRALVALLSRLRLAMYEADELKLARWNGAGAVASAAMTKYKVRDHYPENIACDTADVTPEQLAAHHAYFGGRIELLKYGTYRKPIYQYDIASAYPHAQSRMPSMRGGVWLYVKEPRPDWLLDWYPLSMIRLSWTDDCFSSYPFGPFPYRTSTGQIFFPLMGQGIYCVEEVLAAYRAIERGMPVKITLHEAWVFEPSIDDLPFDFFNDYYRRRQSLVQAVREGKPYDMTEKVWKLALNAAYGKTAQRVGGTRKTDDEPARPPKTANPWYAAAITAATRARLLDAAMLDPDAVIMMATDGIYTTRPIPLKTTEDKTLGAWEACQPYAWGQFVQSGVYLFEGQRHAKTRGFTMARVGGDGSLSDALAKSWAEKQESIEYEYTQYVTLGAATRSAEWRALCGCWLTSRRNLRIIGGGTKRQRTERNYCRPDERLLRTRPAIIDVSALSAPRLPEWVATSDEEEMMAALEESHIIMQAKEITI